jgi:hypothetical protein
MTLKTVTTSGWYEHHDGSIGYYTWEDGRPQRRMTVASWADVGAAKRKLTEGEP